ncbi:MAG: sigma-70 family RNA polymerase sigma factor [Planctomycetes bacterium]|nr:sigma-70 family RNA polymerase sigma factor [Planctomycetota bacterium]
MTTARPDVELLLRHQEWVRNLAHRLVADPATADDVAQETLLAAATRAPTGLREPRGWLRKVAQNAARAFARSTRRRTRRELEAAGRSTGAGDATDPAVTLQRAAAHKRVVDALFAVPEPYHTVLLLRFFDDLGVEAIAARLARPVATVRSQLQRGLARMREILDGEFGGDRGAWCAALAPLLPAPGASTTGTVALILGAMTMSKWIPMAAGLLLAAVLGWQLLPATAVPAPLRENAAAAPAASALSPLDASDASAARTPAESPAVRDEPPATNTTAGVRGRLLTPEGDALPGVTVAWADPKKPHRVGNRIVARGLSVDLDGDGNRRLLATPEGRRQLAAVFGTEAAAALAAIEGQPAAHPRATTDGLGRFQLVTEGPGELVLESDELMLFGSGRLPDEPGTIHIVGRATSVAGVVRDEQGTPLANAYVSLGFRVDALPGLAARLLDGSDYRSWNATSGADGRFSLGRVPVHAALAITAQKRGHATLSTATTAIAGPVDWTLRTESTGAPTLAGSVRHADGSAAAGARVDFGQDSGVADEHGRFSFDLTYWSDGTRLTAWVAGHEPAVLDGLGARLRTEPTAGAELQLWLGGPAKSITGRVLAADGRALRAVRVAVVDATQAGSSDQSIEGLIGDQGKVTSDDQGNFELRGLSSRTYHVRAVDPESLLVLEATNVAAGTRDLELRAPRDPLVARGEGQVVDQRGLPVADARVRLRAVLRRCGSFVEALDGRAQATTDADGRFVLADCPRAGVQWTIDGEGIEWTVAEAPADLGPVRLVVARVLKFRLVRTGSTYAAATAFEVRDATGTVLTTTERRPGVQSMHHRVPLRDTPVYEVDERATTLVLFQGDRELGGVPLQLQIGDVTDVDF